MNTRKKAIYINGIVVVVCLLLALIIYLETGQIILAIFIAPPIIYWILERKSHQNTDT